MVKRPKLVSGILGLVCFFLMATSVLNLMGAVLVMNDSVRMGYLATNKLPPMFQLGMVVVTSIVTFIAAVLIFKGRNSGRLLYLAWSIISLGVGVFNVKTLNTLVPGSLISLTLLAILFFPYMNQYFTRGDTTVDSVE
ncbi:MAG: hypothetical protein AAGF06_01330 [Pseudomonadota bacterium]